MAVHSVLGRFVALSLAVLVSRTCRSQEMNVWYYNATDKVISNDVWKLPVASLSGNTLTFDKNKASSVTGSGALDLRNLHLRTANGSIVEITRLALATSGANGSVFTSNTAITSLYADDVSYVPTACFKNCTALEDLSLSYHPSAPKTMPNDAFRSCAKLKCPVGQFLPPWVTQIGSYMLADSPVTGRLVLTNLTNFALNSTKNSYAFGGTAIEEVYLKGSFATLPPYVFYNAQKLQSLEVDAELSSIGNKAFQSCPALLSLAFHGRRAFTLSTSSTAYNFNSSTKLASVTFDGAPLQSADIDRILAGVTAVAATASKGKGCTIFASRRFADGGWRALAAPLEGNEIAYRPDGTFGVFRNGSRKAWMVHRSSPYDPHHLLFSVQ
ncbi:MAG: leucine-rich repeat protein [Kiritimatiellae bacterium]|nr:leucine-rich repeat protein [Kiritimatiellia bacterium]